MMCYPGCRSITDDENLTTVKTFTLRNAMEEASSNNDARYLRVLVTAILRRLTQQRKSGKARALIGATKFIYRSPTMVLRKFSVFA
jgi:hypothetical protein